MPIADIGERLGLSRSTIAKAMQSALLHCEAYLNDGSETVSHVTDQIAD
ncbi:hypothetical protein [Novosphingobium sp. P6W]|nr:hypothetical protein [Novosphingobium sp. P6W]